MNKLFEKIRIKIGKPEPEFDRMNAMEIFEAWETYAEIDKEQQEAQANANKRSNSKRGK